MAYYVVTCNGYAVERETQTLKEAIGACRDAEWSGGDGFVRLVQHNGRFVADADGSYSAPDSPRYTDAATQTGMYDGE